MPTTPPPPLKLSRSRRHPKRIARVLAVVGVVVAAILLAWMAVSAPLTASPHAGGGSTHTGGIRGDQADDLDDGALGQAGGDVPGGASLHDDVPAISGLDPDLLTALQRAEADASTDDVIFVVNSGWRSAALQQQLLDNAVAEYGSAEEAARWVATPTTSAHVHGDAVDIGPFDATYWLLQHGAAYGLCQIYGNESWHYELRPDAVTQGCPDMFADPTEDPRMRG